MIHELKNYADDLTTRLPRSDFETLDKIGQSLLAAKAAERTIFLAGNGGSAATASHFSNDLLKGCRVGGKPGFRAMCLSESSTLLTCLANDYAYADVYAILLQTYAKADDVFIVFSGSGRSPNILAGLRMAKKLGLATIGFGGRDGGELKALCDLLILAPTDSMEMLEDFHLFYCHNLACAVRAELEHQSK